MVFDNRNNGTQGLIPDFGNYNSLIDTRNPLDLSPDLFGGKQNVGGSINSFSKHMDNLGQGASGKIFSGGSRLGQISGAQPGGARPGFLSRVNQGYKDIVGTPKKPGFGRDAFGVAAGGAQAFLAMKQYGLIKKGLKFQKESFNKQFAANRQTTNAAIRGRAAEMFAATNGGSRTVEQALKEDGIA